MYFGALFFQIVMRYDERIVRRNAECSMRNRRGKAVLYLIGTGAGIIVRYIDGAEQYVDGGLRKVGIQPLSGEGGGGLRDLRGDVRTFGVQLVGVAILEGSAGPEQLISVFGRKHFVLAVEVQSGTVLHDYVVQVIVSFGGPVVLEGDDSLVVLAVFHAAVVITAAVVRVDVGYLRADDGFDGIGPYVELDVVVVLVSPVLKRQYDEIVDAESGGMRAEVKAVVE